jgi:DNA-binding beta-propeller fold protein YncE
MNARRLTLATLASLCALTGGLLFCSAPALAARGHVFSGSFGSEGSGNGQLKEPSRVAVNEETGDVYVVDRGNERVELFSATGTLEGQFNGSGAFEVKGKVEAGTAAPTGQFSEPEGIAIDNESGSPSFGDVYVADTGHHVIDKFSSTGAYIGQLTETTGGSGFRAIRGIATDSSGKLWVCQEEKEIDAFSEAVANEFLSEITSTGLLFNQVGCEYGGFAVDSSDNLYATSSFTGIAKLNSSGGLLIREFDSLIKDFGTPIGAVAVDLSNNEVYIDNADAENSVGRFSSNGSIVELFGSEHLTNGSGIAVDSKTGEVYVAAADRVVRFVLEPESRPTVEHEAPAEVAASSATLTAQIKPTGPDTTYYFQYGTASCAASPASCTDLPAPPGVGIGGGFESQSVDVHPQDLQPATVYHFRVIATNELGTAEGAEETFTTQTTGTEFALPDGRMWEMVTPPNKQGAGFDALGNEQGADIQASADGGAITYVATAPFVANPAGSRSPATTQVISIRRAPGSWETQDITTAHDEGASAFALGHSAEYKLFSTNLSLGLVEPEGDTPLSPLPAGSEKTIYLREANGDYEALVTAANVLSGAKFGGSGEDAGEVGFVDGTPDMSHIVIDSGLALTPNIVNNYAQTSLYEWAGRELQLISVLPNRKPATEEGRTANLGNEGDGSHGDVRHAISNDGSRIVWEAGGMNYLRDMVKGETIQVAEGSTFQTANSEDSRVFLTHKGDLDVFEVTSGEGGPLAGGLTDMTGEGADVLGVIEASEDGSYVYFVANGVLGDGAERGAKSGTCQRTNLPSKQTCNLYVDHYDQASRAWAPPAFIATLSGEDAPSWGSGKSDLAELTSRVSPNGRYLAFMSDRSLTGYENRDANSGVPDEEVFLYDASAERLVCASCNPTGARPVGQLIGEREDEKLVNYTKGLWGDRWLAGNIPGWTTTDLSSALSQSDYLSNSGRLLFDSEDALVPGDSNGTEDVYEYEPAGVGSCQAPGYGQSAADVFSEGAGGCVALISSGTSSEESAFLGASETGGDVFFLTKSRLSPRDYDTSYDVYDAHECTASAPCAAPPALVPPPCTTGDACKPAPTPQPALFGAPASATFSGAGNIAPSASETAVTPRSSTKAQRLVKALEACRKKPKRRRAACESQARKRYGAKGSRARKSLSARTRRQWRGETP